MDHIRHPRNAGSMPDADAVGESGAPQTSHYLKIWIKVKEGRICRVTFKAYGCAPALAAASVITELAEGMYIGEASYITPHQVETALGGLPPERRFVTKLAADALKNAVAKLKL